MAFVAVEEASAATAAAAASAPLAAELLTLAHNVTALCAT